MDLLAVAVADDGAVYICNSSPNSSGGRNGDTNKMFRLYRWADSGSNTLPALVFLGDPSGQSSAVNERWGDAMTVQGSGTNTLVFLNSQDGTYGAVLSPTNSAMTWFTNAWFFDSSGAGSLGRSVQFGPTNTVYEKRKGVAFELFGLQLHQSD